MNAKLLPLLILLFSTVQLLSQEDGCKVRELVKVKDEGLVAPDLSKPWVNTFSEEFDGEELRDELWYTIQGAPVNESLAQMYTADNLDVSDGRLRIQSRREPQEYVWEEWDSDVGAHVLKSGYFEFTAGEIRTNATFDYGAFQARCKLPRGKGAFPAFWTFGDPCWHEIDFFEFTNKRTMRIFDVDKSVSTVNMTIHRDTDCDRGSSNCKGKVEGPDFSAEYHTFTGVYSPYHIHFYCDDILLYTYYRYYDAETKKPFRVWEEQFPLDPERELLKNTVYPYEPMHIFVNLAIFGGKDKPNEDSYTMNYDIDFVRYYQQVDCDKDVLVKNKEAANIKPNLWTVVAGKQVDLKGMRLDHKEHLEIIVSDKVDLADDFRVGGYWRKTKTDSTWIGGSYNVRVDPTFCATGKKLSAISQEAEKKKKSGSDKVQAKSNLKDNAARAMIGDDFDYRFLHPRNTVPLYEMSKGKQGKVWDSYQSEKANLKNSYEINIKSDVTMDESTISVGGDTNYGAVKLSVYDNEGKLYDQYSIMPGQALKMPMKRYDGGVYLLEFKDPLGQIIEQRTIIKA